MSGHCRQPAGIAAGSPRYASITPADNLTLAKESLLQPHLLILEFAAT